MTTDQLQIFSKKIRNDLKQLNQWPAIQFVFKLLDQKRRLCWLSGGAVRDLILGFKPLDIDLTTDASDEEILELFPQAILVGKEFGVFKISLEVQGKTEVYDLTVFRSEDKYEDGRRPTMISRASPQDDSQRRDFTINALFWDFKNEILIDYVQGVADLQSQIIRCVGAPAKRFEEDHLRVLRMARFAYQLNFKIESESYKQGLAYASSLTKISGERILAEVLKLQKKAARIGFYKDPLVAQIFASNGLVFHEVEVKLARLQTALDDRDEPADFIILTELLFLLGFSEDQAELLQKRLKISGAAKAWLLKCCEIQSLIIQEKVQQASDYDFCLLFDKSADYEKILQIFIQIQIIDFRFAQHIMNQFNKHKIPLIEAKHILQIVPHRMISKVLTTVRIMQFQEKLSDFNSALNYVKNLDVR